MTTHAELERRGCVDAVIRLVLSRRFAAHVNAEDWCDVLDVTPGEVRAELDRRLQAKRSGRHLTVVPVPSGAFCPTCGKGHRDGRGVRSCMTSHQPPVPCPVCGRSCNPQGLGVHVAKAHPDHPREELRP